MAIKQTQFSGVTIDWDRCVICGKEPATCREHVPPQGFFPKGEKPEDYLVVPSCKTCNSGSHLDDDYLRTIVAAGAWTEEGLAMWKDRVRPKILEFPKTKELYKTALGSKQIVVPAIGQEAPVSAIKADRARVERVVAKIVRGLYWFHSQGTIVGVDTQVFVEMYDICDTTKYFEDSDKMAIMKQTTAGAYRDPGVTKYFYYQGHIGSENSLWYLFFYRQIMMVVLTGPLPSEAPED